MAASFFSLFSSAKKVEVQPAGTPTPQTTSAAQPIQRSPRSFIPPDTPSNPIGIPSRGPRGNICARSGSSGSSFRKSYDAESDSFVYHSNGETVSSFSPRLFSEAMV